MSLIYKHREQDNCFPIDFKEKENSFLLDHSRNKIIYKKNGNKNFYGMKFVHKKILITLVFILITLSKPVISQSELANNLEKEFNRIATSFPSEWERYFNLINSTGQIKIDKFHVDKMEHRLRKVHRFIDEIVLNFLMIIQADYAIFKTFSFSVNTFYSGYQEFIGAARVNNDWVELAYIQISSSAILIPQFNVYDRERCKKILFLFKKCENYKQYIPRGYTVLELELLLQTMKAHSYTHLVKTTKNILSALQSKEFVLSMNSPYYSDNGKYFLEMQEDGNLVTYEEVLKDGKIENKPIWASQTYHYGQQSYLLVLEKNGELIIYDSNWVTLWKAGTLGKGVAPRRLVVTDNGDLNLIDNQNVVIWRSGRN